MRYSAVMSLCVQRFNSSTTSSAQQRCVSVNAPARRTRTHIHTYDEKRCVENGMNEKGHLLTRRRCRRPRSSTAPPRCRYCRYRRHGRGTPPRPCLRTPRRGACRGACQARHRRRGPWRGARTLTPGPPRSSPSPAPHNITVNRVGEGERRGRRTCLQHVEDGGEGGGDAGAAHVQAAVQGVAAGHGLGAVHLQS